MLLCMRFSLSNIPRFFVDIRDARKNLHDAAKQFFLWQRVARIK